MRFSLRQSNLAMGSPLNGGFNGEVLCWLSIAMFYYRRVFPDQTWQSCFHMFFRLCLSVYRIDDFRWFSHIFFNDRVWSAEGDGPINLVIWKSNPSSQPLDGRPGTIRAGYGQSIRLINLGWKESCKSIPVLSILSIHI